MYASISLSQKTSFTIFFKVHFILSTLSVPLGRTSTVRTSSWQCCCIQTRTQLQVARKLSKTLPVLGKNFFRTGLGNTSNGPQLLITHISVYSHHVFLHFFSYKIIVRCAIYIFCTNVLYILWKILVADL